MLIGFHARKLPIPTPGVSRNRPNQRNGNYTGNSCGPARNCVSTFLCEGYETLREGICGSTAVPLTRFNPIYPRRRMEGLPCSTLARKKRESAVRCSGSEIVNGVDWNRGRAMPCPYRFIHVLRLGMFIYVYFIYLCATVIALRL